MSFTDRNIMGNISVVLNAAFVLFMIKVDAFVVYVSLPTMAREFSVTAASASNVVVAYLLMLTSTMLIFGKIEDKIGAKKLQVIGYLVFTFSSLMCGLSVRIVELDVWRAAQGIGGAMMLTTAFAAMNRALPSNKKGWGMGIVVTAAAIGIATGAPLGGIITDFLSWRWIFFINVPLGIIGVLYVLKIIPNDNEVEKTSASGFDYIGAVLSFIGILGLCWVMTKGNESGADQKFSLFVLSCSLGAVVVFVLWELRQKDPLLEFSIFKNAGFAFGSGAFFTIFVILAGIDFIIPFYLELAENLRPYQVGLFMLLYSVICSVCSPYAGKLADSERFNILGGAAAILAAAACISFAFTIQIPGIWCGVIFIMIWAVSNAVIVTQVNRLIFVNIPNDKQGSGSGIYNTLNNLSMIFGVCVFQVIFSLKTKSAFIKDAKSAIVGKDSMEILFSAFRNIFIFAGFLYIVTLIFNYAGQRRAR